jgi:hypothetical protein
VDTSQLPISGGTPALTGAWPMVGFLNNGCSGVLVAEDLLVYAAHCGARASTVWFGDQVDVTVDEDAGQVSVTGEASARSAALDHCEVYPDWQLGDGSDIAFCTLQAPALPASSIIRPALGCELDSLIVETQVTLVGFGRDTPSDAPGRKRVASATVGALTPELRIGSALTGTCAGDSGSPAFFRTDASSSSEWQLAGVLSSGLQGDGCGVGYYTPLARWVGWLTTESGRVVSPCFDRSGKWQPSAECISPAIADDGTPTDAEPTESQACGSAYAPRASLTASGGCAMRSLPPPPAGRLPWVLVGSIGLRRALRRRARSKSPARPVRTRRERSRHDPCA